MNATNVKCPKCKSKDLFLIELWKDHSITWEQTNGEIDKKDGNLEPGYPYKLEARCKSCSHQWTLKKAYQITQLLNSQP